MDKGWCYFSRSRCTKKLQRTVSYFTCVSCNNTTAVGVLRYRVEVSVAADTDEGLFVAFNGSMRKLHNIRAYETGHLLDGDDDNGDDTPWNTSTLPKVGVEGNKCVEKSSAETSSSGPATEKPLLSATSKVVKKTRKA